MGTRKWDAEKEYRETLSLFECDPLPDSVFNNPALYAERLKLMIQKRGFTNAKLAKSAGICKSSVTNILSGNKKINRIYLYRFAAILGCTPAYLAGLVDQWDKFYSPEEHRTLSPIIWGPDIFTKFADALHQAARKDLDFVDIIFQIMRNGPDEVERAQTLLLAAKLVEDEIVQNDGK